MADVNGEALRRRKTLRSLTDPVAATDLPPHMRWLMPRLLLSTVLLGLSTPVEIAVPVIRSLQRKRGVQSGPAIVSLASVVTGLALAARVEQHPESPPPESRVFTTLIAGALVLPASAAALPATVVLRGRSPLWGWALWIIVRLAAAALLANGVDRAKRRLGAGVP